MVEPGSPARVIEVAAALIRRGDEVLLVQQQGPDDPAPSWSLPGGRVHAGELLHEALAREVAEETGLVLREIGALIYALHWDDAASDVHVVGFIFEATVHDGDFLPNDPDEVILTVAWVPVQAAVELLRWVPWKAIGEPLAVHLGGSAPHGTVWLYRTEADGTERLVSRLPAADAVS